jgi:hypothetical protein
MKSPTIESQTCNENEFVENLPINTEQKIDQNTFTQIETLIQQQFQIFVPALVFEYRPSNGNPRDFSKWDYDDLFEFFSHFGELELLEIQGKISVILFKLFLDAYTSREFLLNSSNYKEAERNNFMVRWYISEDEVYISETMKGKIKKYTPVQIIEDINTSMINNVGTYHIPEYYPSYANTRLNQTGNTFPTNQFATNVNTNYNYYANFALSPEAKSEFGNVMTNNFGNNSLNSNKNRNCSYGYPMEDRKSSDRNEKFLMNGKYTCKYVIQIENDSEFQVARRLIGAKVLFFFYITILRVAI